MGLSEFRMLDPYKKPFFPLVWLLFSNTLVFTVPPHHSTLSTYVHGLKRPIQRLKEIS